MVYTQDLKSCDRKVMRVRVPPQAHLGKFILSVFMGKEFLVACSHCNWTQVQEKIGTKLEKGLLLVTDELAKEIQLHHLESRHSYEFGGHADYDVTDTQGNIIAKIWGNSYAVFYYREES